MSFAWVVLAIFVGLCVGHFNGWISAHNTIATECEKLGKFYVGDKVFQCTKIDVEKEARGEN